MTYKRSGRWKARPTSYAGVMMRSRLEAAFAQFLDARRWNWEYEPLCFAGPDGQYLPDFRILFDEKPGSGIYIEVKPTEGSAGAALLGMLPIRLTHPEAWLMTVTKFGERYFGPVRVLFPGDSEASWSPPELGWPKLPKRISGRCRCGNDGFDPEYGLCGDCWRWTCFNCGVPITGEGPNHCQPCHEAMLREARHA